MWRCVGVRRRAGGAAGGEDWPPSSFGRVVRSRAGGAVEGAAGVGGGGRCGSGVARWKAERVVEAESAGRCRGGRRVRRSGRRAPRGGGPGELGVSVAFLARRSGALIVLHTLAGARSCCRALKSAVRVSFVAHL